MNGNNRIDKRQLCDLIAQYAQVDVSQAMTFVDVVFSLIQERLVLGDEVSITGLGRFHVVESSRGVRRVAFVPDEKLRAGINSPFACFEPVVIGHIEQVETQSFVPFTKDSKQEVENNPVETNLQSGSTPDTDDVLTECCNEELQQTISQSIDQPAEVKDTESPQETVDKQPDVPQVVVIESPTKGEKEEKDDLLSPRKKHQPRWYWGMSACIIAVLALGYALVKYSQGEPVERVSNEHLAENTSVVTTSPVIEEVHVAQEVVSSEVKDTLPSLHKVQAEAPEEVVASTKTSHVPDNTIAASKAPIKTSTATSLPGEAYRKADDGSRAFTTLGAGERLTLIAQREYGDKAFWCYIFEVNRDRLKSPSHVTIGCKLYLPSAEYWKIDVTDPASVKRARQRCANLLNEYKH